jgi:gliding motility-associated-like protein
LRIYTNNLASIVFGIILIFPFYSRAGKDNSATGKKSIHIPAFFTPNHGQFPPGIRYILNAPNTTTFFSESGVIHQFTQSEDNSVKPGTNAAIAKGSEPTEVRIENLSMEFVGKNPSCRMIGSAPFASNSNFFIGNNPSKWAREVENYGILTYENIYQNIDLQYYTESSSVKTDFILHPGSKPEDIKLHYTGMESVNITAEGDLLIQTKYGTFREHVPVACQHIDGKEQQVQVKYKKFADGNVGFEASGYNTDYDLIIDPVILYSTYLGGSGDDRFYHGCVDKDAAGNIYATGRTASLNFPVTPGSFDVTFNGGAYDIFVFKLDPTGSNLLFSTFLGSTNGYDAGYQLELIQPGNEILVSGTVGGADFPVTAGAYQTTYGGYYDVCLFKLNNAGNNLIFSTFIGGTLDEMASGMAVDNNGYIYVTGQAKSGYPTTAGSYQPLHAGNGGDWDAIISKLSSDGSTMVYSTYLGGTGLDRAISIAIDNSGNAYIAGSSDGAFPVMPTSYDNSYNGGAYDVFVSKLNPSGSSVLYSTYIGSSGEDWPRAGILLTSNDELIICGFAGFGYPVTTGAYDLSFNGGTKDMFVTQLNAAGTALVISTYIGSAGNDEAYDISFGSNGEILLAGLAGASFPTTNCAYDQTFNSGTSDAVLCRFNPTLTSLIYSTYIGGSGLDIGVGIYADHDTAYLIGETASTNFPVSAGSYDQSYNGGGSDLFILKMNMNPGLTALFTANSSVCQGQSLSFANSTTGASSYVWKFGDNTSSSLTSPSHTYTLAGTYQVSLIATGSCGVDTAHLTITVNPLPVVNLGHDTLICNSSTLLLNAGPGFDAYSWSTTATTQTITVSTPGYYAVTVTEAGCTDRDTIQVGFAPLPIDIGDPLTVSANNLISHYKLNGNVLDYSGHNLNATLLGPDPATDPCAKPDSAYYFNGTGDYIEAPHSNLYNTQPMSFSYWFRVDTNHLLPTPGFSYCVMFMLVKNYDLSAYLHFATYLAGQTAPFNLAYGAGNGSTWGMVSTAAIILPYTWYHVGGVLRPNKLILFINGNAIDSIALTPPISTNSSPLLIGKSPDYSETRYFKGKMDDIRFYGRELSACEMGLLSKKCTQKILGVSISNPVICSGSSTCININNPQRGVKYQLLNASGMTPVGNPVTAACDTIICLNTGPLFTTTSFKINASWPGTTCSRILDSLLTVTVISSTPFQQNIAICQGDSIFAGGAYQHLPGIYIDTIPIGTLDCDSIVKTTLSVYPAYSTTLNFTICQGDSIFAAGAYQHLGGIYHDSLVSMHSCDSVINSNLIVLPVYQINHSLAICEGDSVYLNGAFQHLAGVYADSLTSISSCDSIEITTLTIHPLPIAGLPADTSLCAGGIVNLNAGNSGSVFLWNTGAVTQSITVFLEGTYAVTITNSNGCKISDSTEVIWKPGPQISIVPAQAVICGDSSVKLEVHGATYYQWTPGTGLSSVTDSIVWANPQVNTTYTVVGSFANGCNGDTTVQINVLTSPEAQLPDSLYICLGETLHLDAGYCFECNYLWISNATGQFLDVFEAGQYWVKISKDGCSVIDTVNVKECMEIWIPNVFSPNSDGLNDYFRAKGINIDEFHMTIFNRWGIQLYETNDIETGWDGRYKGEICTDGVYFYLIEYKGIGSGTQLIEKKVGGSVTLLR